MHQPMEDCNESKEYEVPIAIIYFTMVTFNPPYTTFPYPFGLIGEL